MSMISKIKEITVDMESLAKEKPTVTIVSNSRLLVENYNTIKIFDEKNLVLEADGAYICIRGDNIVVDYFSPARIIARGFFEEISYKSSLVSEEL